MTTIDIELGLTPRDADVGIEIEVETSTNLPTDITGWGVVGDGSLRGNAAEYISRPLKISELSDNLSTLRRAFDNIRARVEYSFRAGVHVHVNVQQLTRKQVMIYAMCYYILENSLTEYCGKDRVGNHFCLRACDAEYVIDLVINSLNNGSLDCLQTDNIRYCALNYLSLFKFGTLEFRALATLPNFEKIQEWAETLLHLRDWSLKFTEMQEVIEYFSEVGGNQFSREAVGKHHKKILTSFNDRQFIEGMRIAQDICHHKYM